MLLKGRTYLRTAPKALKKLRRHPGFLDYNHFCSTPVLLQWPSHTLPLPQMAQSFWLILPRCRSAYGSEATFSLWSIRAHTPPLSVLKEIVSLPAFRVPEKQLRWFNGGGWVGSYFRTLNSASKHYQQQVKESQLAGQKHPRRRRAERQLETHK